jgi:hypothetical protein
MRGETPATVEAQYPGRNHVGIGGKRAVTDHDLTQGGPTVAVGIGTAPVNPAKHDSDVMLWVVGSQKKP